jgi:hypothetical protein
MAALNGVVAEWLAKEYGGRYDYSARILSIGAAATYEIQNNPERASLLVINCSVNTVTLMPEALPTAGSGIILAPSGGSFRASMWEDLIVPALQYGFIASGAASAVLVIEVFRIGRTSNEGT